MSSSFRTSGFDRLHLRFIYTRVKNVEYKGRCKKRFFVVHVRKKVNARPVKANLFAASAKLGFGRGSGTICDLQTPPVEERIGLNIAPLRESRIVSFMAEKGVRVRFGRIVNALWLGES